MLPFASIVQVPIDVYLGKHTGLDLACGARGAGGLGGGAARARTRRAAPAARGSWWCRVAESFAVYCRLAGAQHPRAAAVPRLVRDRSHRDVPALVPRLPRRADPLPQRAAPRRLERARGGVPLRQLSRSRSRSQSSSSATANSSRCGCEPAPSTSCWRGRAGRSTRSRRASSRCAGSGRVLQGLVVFVYALAGVNIDWTSGRVAMLVRDGADGDPALRLDVGRRPSASSSGRSTAASSRTRSPTAGRP